jgi:hypothetical protein
MMMSIEQLGPTVNWRRASTASRLVLPSRRSPVALARLRSTLRWIVAVGALVVPRRLRTFLVICLVSFAAAFVVQTVFQSLGAQRSHWGGNPGWQREIAFWNICAIVIAARAIQLDQAAFAVAVSQGFTALFLLLGTNHLFAFVAEPAAHFHWPPLVLNYVGVAFGVHTLLTFRTRSEANP